MKVARIALVLVVAFSFAIPADAQFWSKKSYDRWSKIECRDMLSQSPWAQQFKIATVVIEAIGASLMGGDPTAEGREAAPHVTYTAKLMSARPIREAMIRQQQLDPKYAKFSTEEKRKFDENSGKFLDMQFPDTVVVQLSYSTIRAWQLPLSRFWKSQSQDELRQNFNIIGDAGRYSPLQVIVSQGQEFEFQLIFPRVVEGKPLVSASSKALALEFGHPGIDGVLPGQRVYIDFPIKKMLVEGAPVF